MSLRIDLLRRFVAAAPRRLGLALAGLALCGSFAVAPPAQAQDAAALKARHQELRAALADNAFQRPLVLESSEPAGGLRGDIYARVDQPFAVVGPALHGSAHWCEILMLHLNVRECRGSGSPETATIALVVGSKPDQPISNAFRFAFEHRIVSSRPDYLQVALSAERGPLGTSRYRIVLEVVALDARHSFLHLSYAYDQGITARLAMEAYLATSGRDKVGFSVVGREPDGKPQYIRDVRGVVERNTMRYYLAVEAYLSTLSVPQAQRFERRLAAWHAAVERYPRQLHEIDLDQYIAIKRRQQASHG